MDSTTLNQTLSTTHTFEDYERQKPHVEENLARAIILKHQLPAYLDSSKEILPEFKKPVILTGEYTPMNFLVNQVDGVWHISGLIDFGDTMLGLPEYDLLICR